MKRILITTLIGLRFEGITSVILNYTNYMNRDGLEFTFTTFGQTPNVIRDKFEALGTVCDLPDRKKDTVSYMCALSGLLKSDHFDAIHIHGNSGTMMIEAALARAYGIKKIFVHGHSTNCNHRLMNRLLVPLMKHFATDYLACSEASGKWLYGKSIHQVLNNAIDLTRFSFSQESREEVRREFGFGEEIIIGHIGHFTETKNQPFLLECFAQFHKEVPASKLLLVSDGPLMDAVKRKTRMLGLEDAVIFTGRRADCDRLYQAMDLFVLPSKWEGQPLVTLEAQAASLPTLVSAAVPGEAKCTDLIEWLDLAQGPGKWAEKMFEMLEKHHDRNMPTQKGLAAAGFDIRQEAEKLRELYLKT